MKRSPPGTIFGNKASVHSLSVGPECLKPALFHLVFAQGNVRIDSGAVGVGTMTYVRKNTAIGPDELVFGNPPGPPVRMQTTSTKLSAGKPGIAHGAIKRCISGLAKVRGLVSPKHDVPYVMLNPLTAVRFACPVTAKWRDAGLCLLSWALLFLRMASLSLMFLAGIWATCKAASAMEDAGMGPFATTFLTVMFVPLWVLTGSGLVTCAARWAMLGYVELGEVWA